MPKTGLILIILNIILKFIWFKKRQIWFLIIMRKSTIRSILVSSVAAQNFQVSSCNDATTLVREHFLRKRFDIFNVFHTHVSNITTLWNNFRGQLLQLKLLKIILIIIWVKILMILNLIMVITRELFPKPTSILLLEPPMMVMPVIWILFLQGLYFETLHL